MFKIFVANPQKPAPISEILARNREKLIEFLKKFQVDKGSASRRTAVRTASVKCRNADDEHFAEEKRILLAALVKLPAPAK